MVSAAHPQATLVDLLDRVLDKGLVIQADLIITLAGVPLIVVASRGLRPQDIQRIIRTGVTLKALFVQS